MSDNELIADRESLNIIEVFMGYAPGYLSERIRWNDLMPVVEKIKLLGYYYKITEWQCLFYKYSDHSGVISYDSITDSDTKLIDVVYKAVLHFIKWFNEHGK